MLKLIHTKDILVEIEALLNNCTNVSILTAFLSSDAIECVFQNKAKGLEVFTSFHNEFVDPNGLRQLLKMNATVYIYTGIPFFHPKVYFFHSLQPVAVIGSSNFTLGGLKNNIELNIITDESSITSELLKYISTLRNDPLFGILTEESLSKYAEIKTVKDNYLLKQPPPELEKHSELQKLLDFSRLKKSSDNRVLKIKLQLSGEFSRIKHKVFWLTKRDVIFGSLPGFFPQPGKGFKIKLDFSGHSFPPISTKITSSSQVSRLYTNLDLVGFRMKPGDIICFEELESKKLYRLWLERESQTG